MYSDACAITDPDTTTSEGVTVVVTGGYSDLLPRYRDNVTRCGQGRGQGESNSAGRYGKFGWVEDMPSLNQGRSNHGCASFANTQGDRVR